MEVVYTIYKTGLRMGCTDLNSDLQRNSWERLHILPWITIKRNRRQVPFPEEKWNNVTI